MDTAPIRGDDGHYVLPDGTRLISVTTVIKTLPKPWLAPWTARTVAEKAVQNIPRLARIRGEEARAEAVRWLKKTADDKRDAAGDLGSAIHNAIEAYILGKPAPEPTDQQRPYMEAFHRFLDREKPVFEATELVVANLEDGWAGTCDGYVELPRVGPGNRVIDWKSGTGAYAEAGMQTCVYRRATIAWLKDGTEITPPPTVGAVVIHIRPSKYPNLGYRMYANVDTSDQVYQAFLNQRGVAATWMNVLEKTALGEPFELDEEMA